MYTCFFPYYCTCFQLATPPLPFESSWFGERCADLAHVLVVHVHYCSEYRCGFVNVDPPPTPSAHNHHPQFQETPKCTITLVGLLPDRVGLQTMMSNFLFTMTLHFPHLCIILNNFLYQSIVCLPPPRSLHPAHNNKWVSIHRMSRKNTVEGTNNPTTRSSALPRHAGKWKKGTQKKSNYYHAQKKVV